jgi:hypothetical protein
VKANLPIWIARILIGIVTFFNLQAAVLFLLYPAAYAPGFEFSGTVGNAMIQAMGLLFVMWNVPYVVALLHPLKYRMSLIEAVIMQGIGAAGETILLMFLPGSQPVLAGSVVRFIIFDGSGFVLLLIAFLITRRKQLSQ